MTDTTPAAIEVPSIYQIGNQLFVALRCFLCAAAIDPNECSISICLPTENDRDDLVRLLQETAPPIGPMARVSGAQAGNFAGKWQGVGYSFGAATNAAALTTLTTELAAVKAREAAMREALRDIESGARLGFALSDDEYEAWRKIYERARAALAGKAGA